MNPTLFTILAILALCVVALAYRQNRLHRMRPATKRVTGKAGNGRAINKNIPR
jgi:hypothetical protein